MLFLNKTKFFYFALTYTLFIIYGSFLPFEFQAKSLADAWNSFKHTPYLKLGPASRADWIANIILYIPLTFCFIAYFTINKKTQVQKYITATLVLIFSLTLATTIEFLQLFFPPRTVSQNDLIAETVGSFLGLVLWFSFGNKTLILYKKFMRGGKDTMFAIGLLYLVIYLSISFFPYDFITSFQELNNKFENGHDSFFISDGYKNTLSCIVKLTSEIFLAVPLGIFFTQILKHHPQREIAVIIIGLILSLIIETIQIFLISGIAQGFSIFTRALGIGLGGLIYGKTIAFNKQTALKKLKKHLSVLVFLYIFIIVLSNNWLIRDFHIQSSDLFDKFKNINWLPFYYHYYTSEAIALTSFLNIFILYCPIGFLYWCGNSKTGTQWLKAGTSASILALIIESGKLFISTQHPDPTNILIGFSASSLTYLCLSSLLPWQQTEKKIQLTPERSSKNISIDNLINNEQYLTISSQSSLPIIFFTRVIAVSLLIIVFWKTVTFPVWPAILGSLLLIYGAILWFKPYIWLLVLPALLPNLDLAPSSGRFFLSEFDLFILVTFAVNTWHKRYLNPLKVFNSYTKFLLAIFFISYLISLFIGLLPLQVIDDNSFTNYYSHYNSLRVGKGMIWAFALLPSFCFYFQNFSKAWFYFAYGILSGLTGVVLISIWERLIFPGLFNYSNDFRITAMFSSMHTGGGHIDTYLVVTLPFIAVLFFSSKLYLVRFLLGASIFAGSLYVLMVTFSRGLYISFIIQFALLMLCALITHKKGLSLNRKKILATFLLFPVISIVAIPILKGNFIQTRFGQLERDFGIRTAHWTDAIQMMDNDIFTSLWGMGLGSYPRTYFWKNSENTVPATYSLNRQENTSFLRLWGGDSLYIEQKISTSPYSKYLLSIDFRSSKTNSTLTIPICEKALLYSFNCRWEIIRTKSEKNLWVHVEKMIETKSTGADSGQILGKISRRPIKLALYNSDKNAIIDIKNISLYDSTHANLLHNGDFSNGLDHWFFSTDNHLPWHSKNIWIQLLFDQGWFGVIIFASLLYCAFINQIKLLIKKDSYSMILLTSLTGFLIIGVISSSFDAPRLTLLFFSVLFIALLEPKNQLSIGKPTMV